MHHIFFWSRNTNTAWDWYHRYQKKRVISIVDSITTFLLVHQSVTSTIGGFQDSYMFRTVLKPFILTYFVYKIIHSIIHCIFTTKPYICILKEKLQAKPTMPSLWMFFLNIIVIHRSRPPYPIASLDLNHIGSFTSHAHDFQSPDNIIMVRSTDQRTIAEKKGTQVGLWATGYEHWEVRYRGNIQFYT